MLGDETGNDTVVVTSVYSGTEGAGIVLGYSGSVGFQAQTYCVKFGTGGDFT